MGPTNGDGVKPFLKIIPIQGLLRGTWLDCEDYKPTPCDVKFSYSVHFNFLNMDQVYPKWQKEYDLETIFRVVTVYYEPKHDFDSSFRGEEFLIARFKSTAQALRWKLTY